MENADGAVRIWWIPKVPAVSESQIFYQIVNDFDEGLILLMDLQAYDKFLATAYPEFGFNENASLGGIEIVTDGEWQEYKDGDGNRIQDLMNKLRKERTTGEQLEKTI